MNILNALASVKVWFVSGLIGALLVYANAYLEPGKTSDLASPFWYFKPVLYIILLLCLIFRNKIPKITFIPPKIQFVLLVWIILNLIEMSLADFGGIGGMHPETLPNFIIAQGQYITLPILLLALVRRYNFTAEQLYIAAVLASSAEGLIFGGFWWGVILSPLFFLLPFYIAVHGLIYACFIYLPYLIVGPDRLISKNPLRIGFAKKIIYVWIAVFISVVLLLVWSTLITALTNNFAAFT